LAKLKFIFPKWSLKIHDEYHEIVSVKNITNQTKIHPSVGKKKRSEPWKHLQGNMRLYTGKIQNPNPGDVLFTSSCPLSVSRRLITLGSSLHRIRCSVLGCIF